MVTFNHDVDEVVRADLVASFPCNSAYFARNEKPPCFFDVFVTKALHDRQFEPQFHHDVRYVETFCEHVEDLRVSALLSGKPHVSTSFAHVCRNIRLVVDHSYRRSTAATFLGLFVSNRCGIERFEFALALKLPKPCAADLVFSLGLLA